MKIIDDLIELKREQRKRDSDLQKYMMCGMALQQNVCEGKCFQCAWKVKKEEQHEKNHII